MAKQKYVQSGWLGSSARSHLLTLGSEYAQAFGMSLVTVSARAAKNPALIPNIKNGGGFGIDKYDEACQWFSDNWPRGMAWPVNIPRPAPNKLAVTVTPRGRTAAPTILPKAKRKSANGRRIAA